MSLITSSRVVAGKLRAAAIQLKAAAKANTPIDPAALAERLEARAADLETAAAQELGRRPAAHGAERLFRERP